MCKHLSIAAEANAVAAALVGLVPEPDRPCAAELCARLVNYGVRCAPGGPYDSVRLEAVETAVSGLPVRVRYKAFYDTSGYSRNGLVTEPVEAPPAPDAMDQVLLEGQLDAVARADYQAELDSASRDGAMKDGRSSTIDLSDPFADTVDRPVIVNLS